MFIDAVLIYGEAKNFSVSVNVRNDNDTSFVPFDLTDYAIKFDVLGSPTANGKILLSKTITQLTNLNEEGQITDAQNGQFVFNITADETVQLGLGHHPIQIKIIDLDTGAEFITLTEGGDLGEFSKLHIVQV